MMIEQSIADWLWASEDNSLYMMRALIEPKNNLIICGRPELSRFLVTSLAPESVMGTAFARVAAEAAPGLKEEKHDSVYWTWRNIMERWIVDGCPMEQKEGHTFSLFPKSNNDVTKCEEKIPVSVSPNQFMKRNKLGHIWLH